MPTATAVWFPRRKMLPDRQEFAHHAMTGLFGPSPSGLARNARPHRGRAGPPGSNTGACSGVLKKRPSSSLHRPAGRWTRTRVCKDRRRPAGGVGRALPDACWRHEACQVAQLRLRGAGDDPTSCGPPAHSRRDGRRVGCGSSGAAAADIPRGLRHQRLSGVGIGRAAVLDHPRRGSGPPRRYPAHQARPAQPPQAPRPPAPTRAPSAPPAPSRRSGPACTAMACASGPTAARRRGRCAGRRITSRLTAGQLLRGPTRWCRRARRARRGRWCGRGHGCRSGRGGSSR